MRTEPLTISAVTTPGPRLSVPALPRTDNRLHLSLRELTLVLERLYCFYEAMHTGKPLHNAESMLSDVSAALSRTTKSS